jgi:hypothetical protein
VDASVPRARQECHRLGRCLHEQAGDSLRRSRRRPPQRVESGELLLRAELVRVLLLAMDGALATGRLTGAIPNQPAGPESWACHRRHQETDHDVTSASWSPRASANKESNATVSRATAAANCTTPSATKSTTTEEFAKPSVSRLFSGLVRTYLNPWNITNPAVTCVPPRQPPVRG